MAQQKNIQRPGASAQQNDNTADEAEPVTPSPADEGQEDIQARANRLNRAQLGPNGWVCPQPKPKV